MGEKKLPSDGGGGRDVRLVSERFGLRRRFTAFRSGSCLEAVWVKRKRRRRSDAIRGRERHIHHPDAF